MIQNEKVYSMLGLCMRAGKLAYGTDMVIENVKNKKSQFVIICEDAAENTKSKIEAVCKENNQKLYVFGTKEELGYKIGKSEKAVVAVLDKNFGVAIAKLLETN